MLSQSLAAKAWRSAVCERGVQPASGTRAVRRRPCRGFTSAVDSLLSARPCAFSDAELYDMDVVAVRFSDV